MNLKRFFKIFIVTFSILFTIVILLSVFIGSTIDEMIPATIKRDEWTVLIPETAVDSINELYADSIDKNLEEGICFAIDVDKEEKTIRIISATPPRQIFYKTPTSISFLCPTSNKGNLHTHPNSYCTPLNTRDGYGSGYRASEIFGVSCGIDEFEFYTPFGKLIPMQKVFT